MLSTPKFRIPGSSKYNSREISKQQTAEFQQNQDLHLDEKLNELKKQIQYANKYVD